MPDQRKMTKREKKAEARARRLEAERDRVLAEADELEEMRASREMRMVGVATRALGGTVGLTAGTQLDFMRKPITLRRKEDGKPAPQGKVTPNMIAGGLGLAADFIIYEVDEMPGLAGVVQAFRSTGTVALVRILDKWKAKRDAAKG